MLKKRGSGNRAFFFTIRTTTFVTQNILNMNSDKHPNSKIVTILRTRSYLDSIQDKAQEFMSMSRKSIGPYWQSVNAKIIGSGLTYGEQEALMPHLVDAEPSDRDFRSKVKNFFESILTHIPYGSDGKSFEIGLEKDNKKPVARDNMPLNVMDFVRYRHAKAHPQVAGSRDLSIGDSSKLFYIYDSEVAEKQLSDITTLRDQAMSTYLSIKDDKGKVSQLLTLMGVDPRDFSGPNADVQRTVRLRELVESQSADFLKVYDIDNFELRYKIKSFINTGVFKTVGDRIFESSSNALIANNLDEAVRELQATDYSDRMVIWMASFQDISAKPKTKRKQIAQ